MVKGDYRVWIKISLVFFITLLVLYIPIVIFNVFPNNYTYQETDEVLLVQHGILNIKNYSIEKNEQTIQDIAVLKYHIHSIHSLVLLTVPLFAFIVVGFLLQFSKRFQNIEGIATSKKRIVALMLMTLVIVLWVAGEFVHRSGNIVESLERLIG